MRIGMILDHEFPPDMRVENEIIALKNAGFDVYILSLNFGLMPTIDDFHGAKVIRIKANEYLIKKMRALTNTIFNFYPHYWSKKIVKFIKENKIDVLHVHDLYMFGAAFLANKHFNLPVVGDLHENYADAIQYYKFSTTFPGNILISSKKWKEKEKEWVSQSDYIITVVEEMKNRIEQYVNSDNVIIYGNYPNLKEFLNYEEDKELLEKYNNKFVITYIGGFDYHRGIDILLESLTFLSGLKDLKLCLIGKGKNLNELKDKINKLNISDKVDFIGWIHSNKLPNYFKLSSIGIIPHLKSVQTDNSSPNKLFQYMAMSVPVISTNCNSLKRMVNESECGLIYEYDNAQELADKIIKLYKNEKLRKEMGENGRKAVIEKYNWENTSKNLIELYEKIEKES